MQWLTLVSVVAASACAGSSSSSARPETIYVFAASSLTDAFGQMRRDFEAEHPGVSVQLNFGGSQALRTQIEQGAPADVYVSASTRDMDMLVQEGFIETKASQILLTNRLVVILPGNNPAGIRSLQDLARPEIKVVLAAPDVPVGNYARQSLAEMDAEFGSEFSARVLANVVSNEDNVKQVVAKIQLGEADAAIVYISDAVAAPSLELIQIPDALNVVATYPIATLRRARNQDMATEFMAFALSPAGRSILQKWGFGPAK